MVEVEGPADAGLDTFSALRRDTDAAEAAVDAAVEADEDEVELLDEDDEEEDEREELAGEGSVEVDSSEVELSMYANIRPKTLRKRLSPSSVRLKSGREEGSLSSSSSDSAGDSSPRK